MLISVARTAQRSAVVAEASCLSSESFRPGICVPGFRLFWVFRSIDPNHEARRLVHVGEISQPLMFGCVHVKAVSWVAILEQKTGKAGGLRSGSFVSVRVHSWFHCAEPFRDASRLSAHPRQSVWIRG